MALLAAGCKAPEPGTWDVVDPQAWTLLDADQDPLGPPTRDCDPAGVVFEEGLVEVDTGLCGWATLTQPTRVELVEGDTLDVLAYHSALVDADGVGTLSLWVDHALVWSLEVPQPAAQQVYFPALTAPADAAPGAPVWLHIDNHGANNWRFAHLKVTREPS